MLDVGQVLILNNSRANSVRRLNVGRVLVLDDSERTQLSIQRGSSAHLHNHHLYSICRFDVNGVLVMVTPPARSSAYMALRLWLRAALSRFLRCRSSHKGH
jgi:hypothetical protein